MTLLVTSVWVITARSKAAKKENKEEVLTQLPVTVSANVNKLYNDTLKVYRLDKDAILPSRSRDTDAGLDLYSLEDVFLVVGDTKRIKTGIAINIPEGYVGKVEDRSGLASKGLRTGAGVVDPGYNGDVSIVMHNISNNQDEKDIGIKEGWKIEFGYQIKKGDKIAQLLLIKVETPAIVEVDTLWSSDRGDKGFNSSGR